MNLGQVQSFLVCVHQNHFQLFFDEWVMDEDKINKTKLIVSHGITNLLTNRHMDKNHSLVGGANKSGERSNGSGLGQTVLAN